MCCTDWQSGRVNKIHLTIRIKLFEGTDLLFLLNEKVVLIYERLHSRTKKHNIKRKTT